MITRRTFGCLSFALACSCAFHAGGAQQSRDFICATADPIRRRNSSFKIVNLASPKDGKLRFDHERRQFHINDYGVAQRRERWLQSDGLTRNSGLITLGVFFVDGSSVQQQTFVAAADQWFDGELGKLIKLDYSVARENSQLRVSFSPARGNYSQVGRNNLKVPLERQTMNIADLSEHVVLHEVGHALGLQHEHSHAASGIVWKEAVVIADMEERGWPEEETKANILNRFDAAANCVGAPAFDRKSIMLYPIPERWTSNGFSSVENMSVSSEDRACLRGLYTT